MTRRIDQPLDPFHHVDPALGRRVDRVRRTDARRLRRFRRIGDAVTETAAPATAAP